MVMYGVCDKKGVIGEGTIVRNLVEHMAGIDQVACFGVSSDEF